MDVVEQLCRSSEDERKFKFYLLRSRDWCNIIPITEDGKVVMVRQHRIGVNQQTLEVPGGVIDASDSDEKAGAIREMEEETGYSPLPEAECLYLGWTFPNPAISNNKCHSYIVGPVRRTREQHLDPGEMIEVVEVPISEIPDRILKGEINHALMLNTFFFLGLKTQAVSGALLGQLDRFTRTGSLKKD
jgi:8-oxo-dGTP pyrophosphatase MutT (NUDIX family)